MNIETVLVPIDFSDVTPKVIQMAEEIARAFGSRLVLLHVSEREPDFVSFEGGPQVFIPPLPRDYRVERERLAELEQTLITSGAKVKALHAEGPLVDKVLSVAREQSAGMIVIGSHGHGALYSLLVGSVTSGVLKSAECPVLVVPADKTAPESAPGG